MSGWPASRRLRPVRSRKTSSSDHPALVDHDDAAGDCAGRWTPCDHRPTAWPGPWGGEPVIDAAVLTTLAQACRDDEPISFAYTARDSAATNRRVEPHRLVSIGRRWYLVAFDRDRQDWRSFRVDRVTAPQTTGQRFRPRELPADDAPAFVRAGIESISQKYDIRVQVALDVETVAAHVGHWAEVVASAGGCELRMSTDDLGWPLMILAQLDGEFVVESPPELRDLVASAAGRFARSVRE